MISANEYQRAINEYQRAIDAISAEAERKMDELTRALAWLDSYPQHSEDRDRMRRSVRSELSALTASVRGGRL